MSSGYINLPVAAAGPGAGVSSLNSLTGALALVPGSSHVTITPSGSTITIDIANDIVSINGDSTAAQTLTVGTAGTDFHITDNGTGDHKFNLPTASATNRGALSSADWSTFNAKQPAGSYITALTGDVTAAGPGSVPATLATVNASPGTYNYATITVNAKGLVTSASSGAAPIGTVTSVALADSTGLFNITGSPVTTTGTLTLSSFQSKTANTFFAAPDGSPGAPTFRAIVPADVPTLNQNTTGTASNVTGIVAVAHGGTNLSTTPANGQLLIGNGAGYTLATLTGSADIGVANGAGSISLSLTNTTVTAASYGDASHTVNFTVDAKGRLTNAVNTAIQITSSAVTDFTTAAQTAAVQNSLSPGSTVKAPSVDSVNTGLATKMTNPMTTSGDIIYGGASGAPTRLAIGNSGQVLTVSSGIPAWVDANINGFGDKSDGTLSVTGSVTLSGPVYYDTLTISGAGSININGYPLYCRTLDLSNAGAGAINWDGNAGNNSSGSAGGSAPGAGANAYLAGGGNGTAGGSSTTTTGNQAAAPSAQNPGNGGRSNASGAGGAGAGGAQAGGASRNGASVSNGIKYGMVNASALMMRNGSIINGGSGGAGGGGGGGSGTQAGTGGGSGGGGGNVVAVFAQTIITTGSTAAGAIRSKGGVGGTAGNASNANSAGGGGGSGGGGGYIYLVYQNKTGGAVTNLIDASGGTGGTGGNGNGTGAGGNGGNGGDGGNIDVINVTTRTGSHVIGSAGSAGNAASGATGGAGGNGGSSVLSL